MSARQSLLTLSRGCLEKQAATSECVRQYRGRENGTGVFLLTSGWGRTVCNINEHGACPQSPSTALNMGSGASHSRFHLFLSLPDDFPPDKIVCRDPDPILRLEGHRPPLDPGQIAVRR